MHNVIIKRIIKYTKEGLYMSFKAIYEKVEELKDLDLGTMLKELEISIIFQDEIPMNKKAILVENYIIIKSELREFEYKDVLLHEIGHFLFNDCSYFSNHKTEENNANLFMCLYLIHNRIWDSNYFDAFLIYEGVSPIIARKFNDQVWQFKNQQIMQYGLTHQYDVNI